MKDRNLSSLSVAELLDLAILTEEKAAQQYGQFADEMEARRNSHAAVLFRQIQTREAQHLRQLQEQRARWPSAPTSVEPLELFDPVEAAPYEGADEKITATDVYQIALQGEERACAFYQKLAEILVNPEARDLARTLWTEELTHVEWVARELRTLPPAPPQA